MLRRCRVLMAGVLLAGCTLTIDEPTPEPTITATFPVASPSAPPSAVPFPTLETNTGPYEDVTALLDGVCFEFLATLGGETWVWSSPADLAAFYDRVDASEACAGPVQRATFDFGSYLLAGAVNTAVGCDAAHRFIELAQDDGARTQTLALRFDTLTGCEYELVQPILIALPRPPEGYSVQVAVAAER